MNVRAIEVTEYIDVGRDKDGLYLYIREDWGPGRSAFLRPTRPDLEKFRDAISSLLEDKP